MHSLTKSLRKGAAVPAAAPRRSSIARREARWGWFFLAAPAALFAVIVAWPTVSSLWQSLYIKRSFRPAEFAWFDNYIRMFSDPLFWNSTGITLLWTAVTVPVIAVLGLLVALAISRAWMRCVGLWRLLFFIPLMTSLVAVSFTWRWMFEPATGLVNQVLRFFGITNPPGWLSTPDWALWAIIIVGIWHQIGYAMILYLAGLQAIPREYFEAASLDGASSWGTFRHITIPLLNPTIVLVTVVLTINALREFTMPFVMSSNPQIGQSAGGPLNSTSTFVIRIYDITWHQFDTGYGAANAVVLLIVTIVIALVQFKLVQRRYER